MSLSGLTNRALLPFLAAAEKRRIDPASGRPLFAVLGEQMIDRLIDMPPIKPGALVVFGMGEVSGAGARRVAEMAQTGMLQDGGTIYFTGGVSPLAKDKANGFGLISPQTAAGISPPKQGEREGPYMARVFKEESHKIGRRSLSRFNVKIDDSSMNTQANIQGAAALGANSHASVGLAALPYHTLRTMATWRQEQGDAAALRPLHAWPDEIGIRRDNWHESKIARHFVIDETKRYNPLDPAASPYVQKGFCVPVDLDAEAVRAFGILTQQAPDAADRWAAKALSRPAPRPAVGKFGL